jgi:hypothetical protein
VHVARLSLSAPDVIVESSLASGELDEGFETVSGMARRYEDAVIAWGGEWGPRARVLVAINGSSFDAETGRPYGGTFQAGWYAEEYGDVAGGTGFVWTTEKRGLIRGCVTHKDELQVVTRLTTGDRHTLDGVNVEGKDGLFLFTAHYAPWTPPSAGNVEAVLQVQRPIGVASLPRYDSDRRRCSEVRRHPLLFDQVVLAPRGAAQKRFCGGCVLANA